MEHSRVESLMQLRKRVKGLQEKLYANPDHIGYKHATDAQTVKLTLYARQKGRCCFCKIRTYADSAYGPKKEIATLEHIECRSNGGSDHISNLAISCWDCNSHRKTMDFQEFAALVETHGRRGTYSHLNAIASRLYRETTLVRKTQLKEEKFERFKNDPEYRQAVLNSIDRAETDKVRNSIKNFYGLT